MKLTTYQAREVQHLLVFGDPKTGKSTLVSQLAEVGYKLIWFSFDSGHSVLKKLSPEAQERVELVIVPDTRDYPVAVDIFREVMKYKPTDICYKHGKHGCSTCKKDNPADFTRIALNEIDHDTIVVFDNLSQLSDSYIALITKDKPVDYKLQLDDWGALRFHLVKGLTDVQQAPINIIGIAHAVEEPITDGSKKIMPAIGSSTFAPKSGGYFDHIIYMHLLNKTHRAGSGTGYSANVITGSRTDKLIEGTAKLGEKPPAMSLLPFFDGRIPKKEQHGQPGSREVVITAGGKEGAPILPTVSAAPAAEAAPKQPVPAVSNTEVAGAAGISVADKAKEALARLKGKK